MRLALVLRGGLAISPRVPDNVNLRVNTYGGFTNIEDYTDPVYIFEFKFNVFLVQHKQNLLRASGDPVAGDLYDSQNFVSLSENERGKLWLPLLSS